jgi:hypothetical protein
MAAGVGLAKGANTMRQLRSSSLVPPGFIVEHSERDGTEVRLTLRPRAGSSHCPGCGTPARRVHSRYRERWRIEATIGRLKDFRRVATRYDKLARTFLDTVTLAAIHAFWL